MKIRCWKKHALVVSIIFAVCLGSIFSANAASKIKSKSVSINASKVTVGIGDIVTLDAIMKPTNSTDTISWSSSKKSVATVNKYGVVTAVSEGNATITAKTSSKKTAKCTVTVKKNLSEEEISALISKNCLSEETVKKLITDNAISESQALALIKQNSISEETVKKMISDGAISESQALELIKENSLTEEDVRQIIAENSDGNSGSSNWQDGEELSIHKQTLPFTSLSDDMTITNLTITKYHFNGEWEDIPQKYKYVLKIEGTMPEHSDISKSYYSAISLVYLNSNGDSAFSHRSYLFLKNEEDGYVNSIYSENDDGSFVLTVEQYNIFDDYDKYMITDLEFGYD